MCMGGCTRTTGGEQAFACCGIVSMPWLVSQDCSLYWLVLTVSVGQFVLFAFFILNKAEGSAIATGILFFLTLGAKLV